MARHAPDAPACIEFVARDDDFASIIDDENRLGFGTRKCLTHNTIPPAYAFSRNVKQMLRNQVDTIPFSDTTKYSLPVRIRASGNSRSFAKQEESGNEFDTLQHAT